MLKNIQCRIEDNTLKFSWKPLKKFTIPTKVKGRLIQVRFIPRGNNYILEIVYEIEINIIYDESNSIVGIDLGVDNFATITNNIGMKPIVVNGKVIKSINQYYNKKKSKIQSDLKKRHDKNWSNKLQKLTDKRYNKLKNYLHNASTYIANWCVDNNIDTLVVGKNNKWKQKSNMGKKSNQNFTYIPYDRFISQLKYKCQNKGIKFITTEESYTSGTSFLDGEVPCKENYDKSRRITRGLFKSDIDVIINADVNASYQIIRKVIPNAFNDGIEGVGLHPVRVNVI